MINQTQTQTQNQTQTQTQIIETIETIEDSINNFINKLNEYLRQISKPVPIMKNTREDLLWCMRHKRMILSCNELCYFGAFLFYNYGLKNRNFSLLRTTKKRFDEIIQCNNKIYHEINKHEFKIILAIPNVKIDNMDKRTTGMDHNNKKEDTL